MEKRTDGLDELRIWISPVYSGWPARGRSIWNKAFGLEANSPQMGRFLSSLKREKRGVERLEQHWTK